MNGAPRLLRLKGLKNTYKGLKRGYGGLAGGGALKFEEYL